MNFAKRILPLIDLTSLSDDDTNEKIKNLCDQAVTEFGNVAAVCVYSKFVKLAKEKLAGTTVQLATVANFPKANLSIGEVLNEIEKSLADGADEIDVVFPYHDYLVGKEKEAQQFIHDCSAACGHQANLKVILETGAFPDAEAIYKASKLVIDAGADFLKTSTGKIKIGATLEAAKAMLQAIKESGQHVGFKASGGIRTIEQATEYLKLADEMMGETWISSETFRFGASSLLNDVLNQLRKE